MAAQHYFAYLCSEWKERLWKRRWPDQNWLVLPDLTTIYVFSGPNEYEAYVKKGTLKDPHLDIELELEAIFK